MLATQIRQKDASSTSSRTRPRTCSTRCASSAASTPRARPIAAEEVEDDDEVGQFIAQDRARPTRRSSAQLSRGEGRGDRELLRDGGEPAADPRHRAAVHRREAAVRAGRAVRRTSATSQEPREQVPRSSTASTGSRRCTSSAAPPRRGARRIHVPCVIFDGKSEDFATEMFVIINSTPTRINKSHLVDLYERVSWAAPDKKFAARVVEQLYREGDSPLRYKINRLGGRSKQEKWILQAELFNEIHRWVDAGLEEDRKKLEPAARGRARATRSCATSCGRREGRGARRGATPSYMVTRPVTIKAMLRVCVDLAREDAEPDGRPRRSAGRGGSRRGPSWRAQFRAEGFYERFPAKGQVERVARIHKELAARGRHRAHEEGLSRAASKRGPRRPMATAKKSTNSKAEMHDAAVRALESAPRRPAAPEAPPARGRGPRRRVVRGAHRRGRGPLREAARPRREARPRRRAPPRRHGGRPDQEGPRQGVRLIRLRGSPSRWAARRTACADAATPRPTVTACTARSRAARTSGTWASARRAERPVPRCTCSPSGRRRGARRYRPFCTAWQTWDAATNRVGRRARCRAPPSVSFRRRRCAGRWWRRRARRG